jgi:arabinan endo-1,5-alpha-L-arabinosidase
MCDIRIFRLAAIPLMLLVLNSFSRNVQNNDSIYHNPLFVNKVLDIGDVNVIDGEDGYFYLYGSGGFASQVLYKSTNLVDWENTGIVPIPHAVREEIKKIKQPSREESKMSPYWSKTKMWAPMIVKVGEKWNMYTSAGAYSGIICLQSDSPVGPFVFPHHDEDGSPRKLIDLKDVNIPFDAIDPCFVKDHKSGRNYLFFGSKYGVYRAELSKDGTKLARRPKFTLVAGRHEGGGVGNGYEGTMLFFHDGYWYMILSPRNDYRLLCWRSKSLRGKFADKKGHTPLGNQYGHEILRPQLDSYRTPDGYALRKTGHSGEIIKDKSGRYFIFCHAAVEPVSDKYWRRAVCMTEIKWDEDGWPVAVTKDRKVSYENRKPNM